MVFFQEQSLSTVMSSGLDSESASVTEPSPLLPRVPSVYTAIVRKITRFFIIGGILGIILLTGTVAFFVQTVRNNHLEHEVNRLNEIILEYQPASGSHTFIIRTRTNTENSKYPSAFATYLSSPITKQTTEKMKPLPSDAVKMNPINLLVYMGFQPKYNASECKIGKKPIGFKCFATFRDLSFISYGKSKKECKKSIAQKACKEFYNLNYTNVEDTTAIVSNCSLSEQGHN